MQEPYSHGSPQTRSMAFHPYNIFLMLTLAGIIMLFLALSISFIYSRVEGNIPVIKLPPIFLFNTLILLGSSATLIWAKRCYLKDETENYQKALIYTIVLTLVFMIAQFIGWQQLFADNIFINSNNGAAYLYLISGLHFAHVIAGLPFLVLFLWTARKRMQEPVSVLVYFSDPEKKLKLRLLTVYWHFLDILWIYLVLFLWINSMIA